MIRHAVAPWYVAAALAAAGCAPPHDKPEAMKAAADELDRRFLTGVNAGRVDSVMATYWNSPDLVSFGLTGLGAHGYDAVKADWAGILATPGIKLEFMNANNEPLGEVVAGQGNFKLTIPNGNGEAAEVVGRYTDIKAKRDGRWVYVLDHASVPMPPPAPPSGSGK
jgi:ketosteroid isomerase-like protein